MFSYTTVVLYTAVDVYTQLFLGSWFQCMCVCVGGFFPHMQQQAILKQQQGVQELSFDSICPETAQDSPG